MANFNRRDLAVLSPSSLFVFLDVAGLFCRLFLYLAVLLFPCFFHVAVLFFSFWQVAGMLMRDQEPDSVLGFPV